MILSDMGIKQAITEGRLIIDPAPPDGHFSPSALDMRVGNEFRKWKEVPRGARITVNLTDAKVPAYGEWLEEVGPDRDGTVCIEPGEFLLAKTLETISLPLEGQLAARVEGRSGLARLGLSVHITAPTIHCGFAGPIVLEMKNHGIFKLQIEPGKTCICQLIFETLSSKPGGDLDSDFQGQSTVIG